MFGKKPQPNPPQPPREVTISRSHWKKTLKWFVLVVLITLIGIGVWIGYSANSAIKKITADSDRKSSLFSLFGDFGTGTIRGQKDGRTNILLLGIGGKEHPGGYLTDTIMVASIQYQDNKLGVISLPRDLWVPIAGFGHSKINEAYSKGENSKKTTGGGGALSSKTVENVLDIPIHYYVSLDFEGFKKIINTVGGVDIYVEKDIYDPYFPAENMVDYSPFKISAGQHHMDGALALKYVRSRKTTSDFDRSRRQQQVMSAVKEKTLSLNILANPKKVTDIINILGDHIRTNMPIDEIYALWNIGKNIDTTNIISEVLDTAQDGPLLAAQDYRGYYIYPRKGIDKFSDLQLIAKNLFKEDSDDIAKAKVEVLNGTNQRGVASTVSQYLSSYGYNVVRIGDASSPANKTIVYDYSGGKYRLIAQQIANHLQASFNTKETTANVDIQVIVGEDYF